MQKSQRDATNNLLIISPAALTQHTRHTPTRNNAHSPCLYRPFAYFFRASGGANAELFTLFHFVYRAIITKNRLFVWCFIKRKYELSIIPAQQH